VARSAFTEGGDDLVRTDCGDLRKVYGIQIVLVHNTSTRMSLGLTQGTRVGVYEIGAALGAGGMGAVYRARDTKLNRDVALKVLLPDVANGPERLTRFRREAQVLASLNHPHREECSRAGAKTAASSISLRRMVL